MSKTFASAVAYPLSWPEGMPRTTTQLRSNFKTTLTTALQNVNGELNKFAKDSGRKVEHVVISSNYTLTDQRPKDCGVAVYFTWDGITTCIAVDRYNKLEDNLQAIYHCIGAERTKLRHGGLNLVKAAFRGYAAIPPPQKPAGKHWRDVLDYRGNSLHECKQAYLKAQLAAHPDRKGGSTELSALVNAAWEQAQRELKA